MKSNVVTTFAEDEAPTRSVNDAPTLLRIKRLAALARQRIEAAPRDMDALCLACRELHAIETLAAEALR